MHTETDTATRDNTITMWTGHSRRYLITRRIVRAVVAIVPLTAAYVHYLVR